MKTAPRLNKQLICLLNAEFIAKIAGKGINNTLTAKTTCNNGDKNHHYSTVCTNKFHCA